MSHFRLTNLVFTLRLIKLIKNADTFGVIRGNTTDNFLLCDNLKALGAAEQERAMADNNKRYELKLRLATCYNVAKSAQT